MKRVKVLMITGSLNVGGMERIVYQIATRMRQHKYRLTVWCLLSGGYFADELQKEGIEVRVLQHQSWRNPLNFMRLANQIREGQFQIVHAHGYDAATIGRITSLIARIPIRIVHLHSGSWLPSERSKKQIAINKFLSIFTDQIIACSHAVREYTIDDEYIHPGRIITIHNGIDVERFKTPSSQHQPVLDLTPGEPIVGTVARLDHIKGHEYLLQAAKIVLREFPSTKFVMIGDGPRREEFEKLTAELRISSNIIFTGMRSDVPALLSRLDVFVLPTAVREGLPLSVPEAMAASKPVVATRVGGTPEVVIDGETGFLVPPKDPEALADKILRLLRNPTMAKSFGNAGKQRCIHEFNDRVMVQRIANLYDELITQKL